MMAIGRPLSTVATLPMSVTLSGVVMDDRERCTLVSGNRTIGAWNSSTIGAAKYESAYAILFRV